MRLATFAHRGRTAPGRLEGDRVVDLSRGRFVDLGELLLAEGPDGLDRLTGPTLAFEEVRLLAPIPRPPKFVAVGLNYAGHAREQNREPPTFPMFFAKARGCVIGPDEPIVLPPGREKIDVEVELGVVFGRPGLRLSPEQAMQAVLGFTILNDVSDRQAQKDDRQFYRAKSWPTFGPCGPVVVTPDEFDHRRAMLRLWRSGELQQEASSGELIFGIEELISILSQFQAIEPGDLLATGTPEGVGVFRDPPVFLRPGDVVECEIEGLGRLVNPVRAAS